MLRLIIASIAVALAWTWLREEVSRTMNADGTVRKNEFLMRGAVFVIALIWFLRAAIGAFGTVLAWGLVLAVLGGAAWFLRDVLQRFLGDGSRSEETSNEESSESDDDAA